MKQDWYKVRTGVPFKDRHKLPTLDGVVERRLKKAKSNYPLRLLGRGEKDLYITEEERAANFHVLGAPGEGKSRFIEYNIRKDIELGNGLCLLDPSERGDTVQNVLSYCDSIGFKKIILIDPTTIKKYDKVPIINPLKPDHRKESVAGLMESLSILFGAKNVDTPRIRRYLSALLRILTTANLTLAETKHFATYWDESQRYRDAIFKKIYGKNQRDVQTLRDVLKSEYTWQQYFSSTINRLDALWDDELSYIFGSTQGINFTEAVSRGWVILVNLSPYTLNADEARLLGIIVISQIVQAINTLVHDTWKGVFYLYMDEAGRFATPQIDEVLTYKRKSGLRMFLAHHGFEQFEDKKILRAVLNGARIKLMLDTPDYDDRVQMMKALGYGGDLPPALAAFANQNLPKQYAVIRKHKDTPVRIRLPEVPDMPPVSEAFLHEILSYPFYKSKEQINDEINARITLEDPKSPRRGETSNVKADNKGPVSKRGTKGLRKSSESAPVTKRPKPLKF